MKLVRFGDSGGERPGVWVEDRLGPGRHAILDVRKRAFDIEDFNSRFFKTWGVDRLRGLLREDDLPLLPADSVRLGPPIGRPGKIVCVGRNYANHAAETGGKLTEQPVLFAKAPTAIIGPSDPITLPRGAVTVDGEVELAVVIGRTARRLRAEEAMDAIAGFMIANDVTDRDVQRASPQWFLGKGADSFFPLGPFLVTPDEWGDPYDHRLTQRVNGRLLQDADSGTMHHRIGPLLAFITERMTLEPGDVISTGTPGGIGSARIPPILLRPGDVLESAIDGLGTQRNAVRRADL